MLAEGTSFKGKMFFRGEVRLGGHVEGHIVSDDDLIIEESAVIEADIHGMNVQVSGQIKGNIKTQGVLILTPTARMTGNIQTPHLVVEDGAVLHGNVSIEEEPVAQETSSTEAHQQPSLAAS
jgi:cytoskeletal protein CcmA (bactofilin family)